MIISEVLSMTKPDLLENTDLDDRLKIVEKKLVWTENGITVICWRNGNAWNYHVMSGDVAITKVIADKKSPCEDSATLNKRLKKALARNNIDVDVDDVACALDGLGMYLTQNPDVLTAVIPDRGGTRSDVAQTDQLIELGLTNVTYFHTSDQSCYAAVKLDTGGAAICRVSTRSRQFIQILTHRYYVETGRAPKKEALSEAIGVFEQKALFEGDTIELHNRVAWHNGSICYDLTNDNYEAIEIRPDGWSLMPPGHILFKRYSHQIPQVYPVPGGDPWKLFEFVNVSESDQLLVMVYIVSCLIPDIPHPVPLITGEHGSAKSSTCRLFKALIDPSKLEGVAMQHTEERLTQLLDHHWLAIFDNVEHIWSWQSAALCRAVTGEGTSKRALYTDDDDIIYNYKRCIGLNGINNVATKPDLLDRAFFLNLETIPDDKRIHESVLKNRLNEAKLEILGGILDVLSKALKIYPTIELSEMPRMADFTLWGCAIAEATGHTKEEFLGAYYANIERINRTALEEEPLGLAILSFMKDEVNEWEGTPTQLLNELTMIAEGLLIDVKSSKWVKTPESLGKRIRVILPNLRREGIDVTLDRSNDKRVYRLTYHYVKKLSQPSHLSPTSDLDAKLNCHELSQPSHHEEKTVTTVTQLSPEKQQRAGAGDGCDGSDSFFPILRGEDVMKIFAKHIKKYGESKRAYILTVERIIDMGYDRGLVEYCATKFHEGHRVYIPPQEVK